ncbi:lasso peptide biosynthesis B2 protein [uncultured Thiodictyon sp.]|uniref:lasso peptide biosynthesis B2 protein n=1 Tax=uncultured Thiodictyon sp. TaxID=1846217 RepID=UPI0025F59641|nr:lasso peptide biosynthesis B2 protein [uncultured Thiodictyon sp.]
MASDRYCRFMTMVRRKAGAWQRMPWSEKGWFLVAYPLLGLARLALLSVPFRYIAPRLGQRLENVAVIPLATGRQITQAWHIGRAIRIAACYTPWESKCLAQAMVARVLLGLRRLPYALYLGVRKDDAAGMAAHAWVCTGAAAVAGGYGFGQYTVVGTFVSKGIARGQCTEVGKTL